VERDIALEVLVQWGEGIYSLPLHPGSIFFVHACPPVVSYLSTELAECSMDPEISSGARKLTRIPRVIKKKKVIQEIIN
jgi:hypothetical protein